MLLIGILKWQWKIDYLGRSCEAWESGYIRQPYYQQNIVCIFSVKYRSISFDGQFPNSCTMILDDSLAFILLFRLCLLPQKNKIMKWYQKYPTNKRLYTYWKYIYVLAKWGNQVFVPSVEVILLHEIGRICLQHYIIQLLTKFVELHLLTHFKLTLAKEHEDWEFSLKDLLIWFLHCNATLNECWIVSEESVDCWCF